MTVDWIAASYRLGRVRSLRWSITDNIKRWLISWVYSLFSWSIIRLMRSKVVSLEYKLLLSNFIEAQKGVPIDESDERRLERMEVELR